MKPINRRSYHGNHRGLIFLLLLVLVLIFLWIVVQSAHAASATFGWDQSDAATGYKLYYGEASGSYSKVIDVKNVLSYTIPDLADGVTYYFAATAYNTSSESDYSTEVVYTTTAIVQNARGATVTATTRAGFFVTWDTLAGAAGYKIKYGTVKGSYTVTIDAKTANPYLITGLANGTTYYLIITAYNSAGIEIASSAELAFKTLTISGLVGK